MRWTDDELTVLFAIFHLQGLLMLDDAHPISGRIAEAFGRERGAVDRQARNLKHHHCRLDPYGWIRNIGAMVRNVVDRYRLEPDQARPDAQQLIGENWPALPDLFA